MRSRPFVISFAFVVLIGIAWTCPIAAAQNQQARQPGVQVLQNPAAYEGTPEQRCAAQTQGRGGPGPIQLAARLLYWTAW